MSDDVQTDAQAGHCFQAVVAHVSVSLQSACFLRTGPTPDAEVSWLRVQTEPSNLGCHSERDLCRDVRKALRCRECSSKGI